MSRRFRLELGLSLASAILLVPALVVPDWIETVLHLRPDGGSGRLEWALPLVLASVAAASAVLARRERRSRGPRAAASSEIDHLQVF